MQKSLPGLTSTSCAKQSVINIIPNVCKTVVNHGLYFILKKKKTCEAVNQFIQFISII